MTLFDHHLLALGITSASTLGLGLFVLYKNPKRNLHRSMALYGFSLSWWSGWECAALHMPTRELTRQLMQIEYIGVSFIPTLLCTTVSFLLDFRPQTRRRFLLPLYAGSAMALFVSSIHPTSLFLDVTSEPVAYLPIWGLAGPHYWPFLVFFMGAFLSGIALTFRAWRGKTGPERAGLALFLVGSIAAYAGGCPEFALKYGVRLGWLNPFGLYGVPLFIGLMAYAIVQRGFLGIHIAIRKSLVYSILVTLLTVGYFGLIYGIERLFQTKFGYHSIGLSVAAFALMALAFQPLKMGIQRLVDQLLFRVPHEELVKRMERLEREVKQTDKLRAIATLAAGMAHEIKNPLASIKTFAEYLPMRYDDPAFRTKFSKIISQEVDKMNALVHRLLEFAKPATPHLEPVRLSQVVNDTLEFLQGALVQKQITVQVAFAQTDEVLADTVQLKQVFLNVLLNSIEALGGTGQIHIATTQQNGSVHATITDTGSGIAKDDLPRVFEPFYTTKPRGTGLGLSVVHSIVREHGGRIAIESERGQGTTVEISLPLNGGAHGPHAHSHRG